MKPSAVASSISDLLDETKDLERDARLMQEQRPSSMPEDTILEFTDRYQTWYATALELLPDDLRQSFAREYDGGRFLLGISAFIAAPTQPNAIFAKAVVENPDSLSALYWQYPAQTTFEPKFIKQQALLRQARQRYIQLSTIPDPPISGIFGPFPVDASRDTSRGELILKGEAAASSRGTRQVVFIAHGRSLIYLEVYRYLKEELGLEPVAFETEDHTSEQVSEILDQYLNVAIAAIIVMTGEDQTIDHRTLARQNVIHEAGLFQGKLGFDRVVMLKEHGVVQFSNAQGLIYISFDPADITASFYRLRRFLAKRGLVRN